MAATVERIPPPDPEDLEVIGAALPEHELAFAGPAEQQVRVRVDESGRHRAAAGVEPREPTERIAFRPEHRLHGLPRADRRDAALPTGDDRRAGRAGTAGIGRAQPSDLALIGS